MINAAIVDSQRIVTNIVVLDSLSELPGAVACPAWVSIGMSIDTPEPAPVITVPQSVTPRQARLALSQQGKLAAVNTAVAAADDATKITWEFALSIDRTSPLVATLGAAIGLTDSQIDDLFILAATL